MTHVTSCTALIWIAQWEYQCCGTPISTGDIVDLTVHDTHWPQPWTRAVGQPICLAAEHHVPPKDSYHLRVRINRLLEARAHREQRPGDDAWQLVPDSGEIQEIRTMRVWDEDWQPARRGGEPEGWILDTTVLETLPPRRENIPYGVDLTPRLIRPDETDLPRLDQWSPERAADPNADPQQRWNLRTPLLAAWQPVATPAAPDERVTGHPCIITWADNKACLCLFVGHGGLHEPVGMEDTEEFVQLTPPQFFGRVRRLLASDWPGFNDFTHAGTLQDFASLFPDGIPGHLPE